VLGNMITNPFKGLWVIIFIYFPLPFLLLILLGAYYIFFYTKKSTNYISINKRASFYLITLASLALVGFILRILIEDEDYDSFFRYVYNFAYLDLSLSGKYFFTFYLFEFIIPLAFLFFVFTPWLIKRNTNAIINP
jgi:hypothetical protein